MVTGVRSCRPVEPAFVTDVEPQSGCRVVHARLGQSPETIAAMTTQEGVDATAAFFAP
jgi:hypothetical protein